MTPSTLEVIPKLQAKCYIARCIMHRKILYALTHHRKFRQEADYPEHGLERAVHYRDSDPFSKLGKVRPPPT